MTDEEGIGFIGAGNMAQAIGLRLINEGIYLKIVGKL